MTLKDYLIDAYEGATQDTTSTQNLNVSSTFWFYYENPSRFANLCLSDNVRSFLTNGIQHNPFSSRDGIFISCVACIFSETSLAESIVIRADAGRQEELLSRLRSHLPIWIVE